MEKEIKNPLISVIMPLYNAQNYVAVAIQSVINQTYTNWELIVVNDGSTDNSLAVVKQFENDKIKIFTKVNSGAAATRNYGYNQAKGEYIKFFDADDIINTQMLSEQVKLSLKNPLSIISGQWGRFFNDDLSTFKLSREECWQNMNPVDWLCSSWYEAKTMTQPGIFLIPYNLIKKAGYWNENLSLVDDMEFFTKSIIASAGVIFCNKAILYYRSGMASKALSGQKTFKAASSFFKSISLSVMYLLQTNQHSFTKLCCANIWQSFVYEYYFQYPDLAKKAEKEITLLGGSDLKFLSGKTTRIIAKLFGWKFAKRLREMI